MPPAVSAPYSAASSPPTTPWPPARSSTIAVFPTPLTANASSRKPKLMILLSPHPHILQNLDDRETDDRLSLLLDLCELDTLYDCILSHKALPGLRPPRAWCNSSTPSCVATARPWPNCMRVGPWTTPYSFAPEVLMGREYGKEVDVWSAGVVLYVMIAGSPLFQGESAPEVFEAVLRGNLRIPARALGRCSSLDPEWRGDCGLA
ncbi:hypothetical protein NL676_020418 [Syzygium grande]|nr:hypothetical protein NL676_020418 [Syzygium grande]